MSLHHINTRTVTTPASARRWAGIERTLHILLALSWVALLSVTLLIVAEAVAL